MGKYSITRTQILNLLENALKPLDYVYAMWEEVEKYCSNSGKFPQAPTNYLYSREKSIVVADLIVLQPKGVIAILHRAHTGFCRPGHVP